MLGFILSKINLLILVVAIFAIVSYFSFGLTDLIKVKESELLLDRLSQKTFSLASSPSYCFSDSFDLPNQIQVAGTDFYYLLKISVAEIQKDPSDDTQNVRVIIFSMHPRVEYLRYLRGDIDNEPAAVASSSIRTDALVTLYSPSYNYQTGAYDLTGVERIDVGATNIASPPEQPVGISEIIVDPNAETRYNVVEFIKEVRQGKTFVYIYPCSILGTSDTCGTRKEEVQQQACEYALPVVNESTTICSDYSVGSGEVFFAC